MNKFNNVKDLKCPFCGGKVLEDDTCPDCGRKLQKGSGCWAITKNTEYSMKRTKIEDYEK